MGILHFYFLNYNLHKKEIEKLFVDNLKFAIWVIWYLMSPLQS